MNIAIIGCGFLGMEIADYWSKKGHHVTVTTRNPNRLSELSKVAQKSLILKGDDPDELAPIVANNEVLLITIAADSPEHYESAYLNTAQIFRTIALEMDQPRYLIYTSSTSVYGDHNGMWVDEASPLNAITDQAKILIQAEHTYLSLAEIGWQVCILRLAEIYGPGRELSKRVQALEGHALPGSGDRYTNMIHKADIVAAIDYVLRHNLEGVFNLTDDDHPHRKELYDLISEKHLFPKVKWDPTHSPLHIGNKRVSNHKIKGEGFTFLHPHRDLS